MKLSMHTDTFLLLISKNQNPIGIKLFTFISKKCLQSNEGDTFDYRFLYTTKLSLNYEEKYKNIFQLASR